MKKIRPQDWLANVCNHENPGKGAPETQVEGERLPSERGNMRAVGGLEVEVRLWVLVIGCGGREHADCCAGVYEKGEVIGAIVNVHKTTSR